MGWGGGRCRCTTAFACRGTWTSPSTCGVRDSASNTKEGGASLLSGPLPDQAALQGVLLQIVRMHLPLLWLEACEARGGWDRERGDTTR